MTCIIGFSNGQEVHIAGDSGGFSGIEKVVRSDEKVFPIGDEFIVGFAGSYRLGQLLRYDFTPPARPSDITDMAYLVSYFIESLRTLLKDKGYCYIDNNQETIDGLFLLGYRGHLYCVDQDFHVGMSMDGIDSIGAGSSICIGAFDGLSSVKNIKQRLFKALDITEKRSTVVLKPFTYEVLK